VSFICHHEQQLKKNKKIFFIGPLEKKLKKVDWEEKKK
jgi:hypothetical protein